MFTLSFSTVSFDEAFAAADFSPIQTNAYVSYDNSTNQVQVEWDFTTGGVNAPETCLVKGDFWFFTDLDNAYNTDQSDSDTPSDPYFDHVTRVTGFIPINYSVVSSSPETVDNDMTEVIPCTGSARIDLDTVMSHESNVYQDGVTPREDLQIFLSFYAIDGNTGVTSETFSFQSTTYMDQIFVFYTPDVTWSTAAKTYACGGEPGNVLYIDASASDSSLIAHGNNGDNCDQYLYIENNEYVDIGGANNAASLTDGQTFYDDHIAGSFSLLFEIIEERSNNSSCGDCTPPTFGINKNNLMLVNNGFTYNGNSIDVTDYHTLFPLITVVTNQTNTVSVKVYENRGINNISNVQFGMGMPEVGSPLNDAQTLIEVWLDDGMIEKIVPLDENNLVTITNVTTDIVSCGYTPADCLQVTVDYIYRDQPKYNVMAINSMDGSRNSQTNYMNDGVLVTGQSMNAPLTQDVTVSKAGMLYPQRDGTVELSLVDYKNDLWQDPFGYMWTTNQYGPYLIDDIPLPIQEPDPIWQVMDRSNSHFDEMIQYEQARATLQYDASKSKSVPDDIVTVDYTEKINKSELRNQILLSEAARAEVTKEYLINVGHIPLEKEPNMTSGYEVRENEREFQLQSMPAKPYAEVKLLNGMLYVSGFAGYTDYDKPVIITKIYGDSQTQTPIQIHNDGLFYIAVLQGFYDEMTVTHNGYELSHLWN